MEAKEAGFTANPPSTTCRQSELCHRWRFCLTPLATPSAKAGWPLGRNTGFSRPALMPSTATCWLGAQPEFLYPSVFICKMSIGNTGPLVLWVANGENVRKAFGGEPVIGRNMIHGIFLIMFLLTPFPQEKRQPIIKGQWKTVTFPNTPWIAWRRALQDRIWRRVSLLTFL